MFPAERQKIIKTLITKHGQVEVTSLSTMLNVSEVTIRKDLEKLQKDLFLVRTHGGAILQDYQNENQDLNFTQSYINQNISPEKIDELATLGSMMIQDNDTIMLIDGIVNRQIATKLESKDNITIITNDVFIAQNVKIRNNSKLIVIGGELDIYENTLYGHFSIKSLREFYVDKCFAEIDGLSEDFFVTCKNPNKAVLIEECFKNANEKILIFDSSIYKKKSLYKVGKADIATSVLTTIDTAQEVKDKFFNFNIKVYTPVNILERGSKI